MAHIPVPEGLPGIVGLLAFRPETAKPLNEFTQVLLRGPSSLTEGERELIAAYVSSRNQCIFCTSAHSATAKELLNGDGALVEAVKKDFRSAPVSPKMKALLHIAGKVQADARTVSSGDVEAARQAEATDQEIHDTVLIAAAFCMFNRYVDGLGAFTPTEPAVYDAIGQMLASQGYNLPL